MNATSLLVYPGPTATHRHPSIASRGAEQYGTLLGWAQTPEVASRAATNFMETTPAAFHDLTARPTDQWCEHHESAGSCPVYGCAHHYGEPVQDGTHDARG